MHFLRLLAVRWPSAQNTQILDDSKYRASAASRGKSVSAWNVEWLSALLSTGLIGSFIDSYVEFITQTTAGICDCMRCSAAGHSKIHCLVDGCTRPDNFYRAMPCMRGTIAWPCVCPSVTSRSSTKTAKRRITKTAPHDSAGTLVF